MKAVLQLFWQICLLRQSPAYVPTESWFVVTVIVANLACSLIVSLSADTALPPLAALTSIVVGQATILALTWVALQLRNFGKRYLATVTALFGCDLIITATFAVLLPVITLVPAIATLMFLLFLVWSVSVAGYILQRALEVHLVVGVAVAMGMSVLSLAVSQLAIGA